MKRSDYIQHVTTCLAALNPSERAFFCNGVGSKLAVLRWVKPPADIVLAFDRAANWHDVAYWLGGTPAHKAYADAEFYAMCLDRAFAVETWTGRMRYRIWALLCLLAIRIAGDASFDFFDRPLDLAGLKKLKPYGDASC